MFLDNKQIKKITTKKKEIESRKVGLISHFRYSKNNLKNLLHMSIYN